MDMKKIRWYFGLYTSKELTQFCKYVLKNRNVDDIVYHSEFCNWLDDKK